MNLHSSFSLQSENINISVLFPMITVYKASLGWKWIVLWGGGRDTMERDWARAHNATQSREKKEQAKEGVYRACVEPLQEFLHHPIIILKILNLD